MPLPRGHVALAATAQAELLAAQALVGTPLPPVQSRSRPAGEPMHIVYLMPRTGVGGGARVLLEHANHLEALGMAVTVISHHPRPDWFALRAAFLQVPFGQRLDRSIPACDVIVAGYWSQILLARYLGIAPVVHFEQGDFHLYDEVGDGMRALVAASLQAADWTITVGVAAQAALAERYGVDAERIPNAVDLDLFFPQEPRPHRTVLFVGWDGTQFKGIDIARQVAAGLAQSHPDLGVVWVTPSAPVAGPLGEVVVSPSQEDLARRYREATVYVGASRYESFPLPPLEAMASGVPVVSTANAGVLSYAVDGDNCLLAPVDDVEGLLAATRAVLDDDVLAARLRAGGLASARSHSWPRIMAALAERFAALVASAPSATAPDDDLDLEGIGFCREQDRDCFAELLALCPYREVAVPVSQPVLDGYRLVRWKVVARRTEGIPGTACMHLPAVSALPVEDSDYQFGIDLLREGMPEEAFAWFASQSRQAAVTEQVLLGRWIVLSLLAGGRVAEAQTLAETFAAEYPAHADYYLLAAHAAQGRLRPDDLASLHATLDILGPGAMFSEWLDTALETPALVGA